QVRVQLTHRVLRELAPAAVLHGVAGDVDTEPARARAVLRGRAVIAEGTPGQIQIGAPIREPVLHADRDASTERIETIDRARADQTDAVDRHGGKQVPVDRVAKGL